MNRRKKKRGWGLLCLLLAAVAGAVLFGCGDSIAALLRARQGKVMETAALEEPAPEDGGQAQAEEGETGEGEGGEASGETAGTEKYYFQQLNEKEKEVYGKIRDGLLDFQEEIELDDASTEEIDRLYGLVMKDYPELFWCDGAGSVVTSSASFGLSGSSASLRPEYNCTEEEKEERRSQIEEEAARCLAGIDSQAGDYEKILYVYEYVIRGVEYDLTAEDNQNIYSVFVGKRSVCAGYAKAVQYLLERLGVFCTYVSGTAVSQSGEGGHAWNLVMIEGDPYLMDATWGNNAAAALGACSYEYLNLTNADLAATHPADMDLELPVCVKTEFNYYVQEGLFFETFEEDAAGAALRRCSEEGGRQLGLRFGSSEAYGQARQALVADSRIAEYCPDITSFRYMENENLHVLTLSW